VIDQAGNQPHDVVDLLGGDPPPAGRFPQVDAGLPRRGSAGGVVGKDQRQGAVALAVGR
jgi:hypothetical protein